MGKEKKTKRFYALDYSDQCTKNYYRLLLDYEESIYTAPTNNVERRSNAENIKVGNVVWSKYESNMFFKALARFSKKRPVEIAKWIGTKTPIEVMELIDYYDKEVKLFSELGLLERLCHKDIPAAREMSDEWLEFEASQVEELQKKTERITKIEKKALFNVKHGLIKDGEVDQRKLNLFKSKTLVTLIKRCTGKEKNFYVHIDTINKLYDILKDRLATIIYKLMVICDQYKRLTNEDKLISKSDIDHVLKFNEKQSMPAPPEISHNVLKVEKEDDVDIILNVDQQKDYVTDKLDRLRDEHYEKELKNILDKNGNNTGDDNTGDDNIGIDGNNTGDDNTGDNNTGVDSNNKGDDNTGGNNTGVDGNNTGDDNTGGNNTGVDGNNTGGNNTGVDGNNTGDDNTGGNNTGSTLILNDLQMIVNYAKFCQLC
ncbi:20450_t:CDS:2 [Entrophospora sp. SA101]|nr:20450_t:CDS:2 [Entrophospora sp. SA101]